MASADPRLLSDEQIRIYMGLDENMPESLLVARDLLLDHIAALEEKLAQATRSLGRANLHFCRAMAILKGDQ